MKPSEYLDKCKIALQVKSDYALGKALEINDARISDYYKDKRVPDAYACARIALALKLEPLEVLADIESQSAKTEAKREFWRGFIGHSGKAGAAILWVLACGSFYAIDTPKATAADTSPNVYYVKLYLQSNDRLLA